MKILNLYKSLATKNTYWVVYRIVYKHIPNSFISTRVGLPPDFILQRSRLVQPYETT